MDDSDDDQHYSYSHAGSSSNGRGRHRQTYDEDLPHSVRGAPAHMRAAIRRRQNTEASRRSRDRQNEELRELVEKCNEQSEHINELEERIEALVRMLEEAGISLPSDINDTLCDNLGNDIDSNAEQIFDELTHILDGDKVDDDHEEEQEGEEEYEYEYER